MKVIEIEKSIFKQVGSNSSFAWRLEDTKVNDKPIVQFLNTLGKPMKVYRFIEFDPFDPYMAEVYGKPFRL